MNALFTFASASDLQRQSNHAKLLEFRRLDNEIQAMQEAMSFKEMFHSLSYTIMVCRAQQIAKELQS